MKIRRITLLFVLSLFVSSAMAQIKTYDFEGFKPLLEQQNDTTYVINFWATWCIPCVKELPDFDRVNREMEGKAFKMILVSLDFGKEVQKRVIDFKKARNLSPEIILLDDPDGNSWIPQIDPDWSGSIPATIIYKNKHWQFIGHSLTYEELKKNIQQINQK